MGMGLPKDDERAQDDQAKGELRQAAGAARRLHGHGLVEPMKAQDVGRLNSYVNWYTEHISRYTWEQLPIGLLICQSVGAEAFWYALGGWSSVSLLLVTGSSFQVSRILLPTCAARRKAMEGDMPEPSGPDV